MDALEKLVASVALFFRVRSSIPLTESSVIRVMEPGDILQSNLSSVNIISRIKEIKLTMSFSLMEAFAEMISSIFDGACLSVWAGGESDKGRLLIAYFIVQSGIWSSNFITTTQRASIGEVFFYNTSPTYPYYRVPAQNIIPKGSDIRALSGTANPDVVTTAIPIYWQYELCLCIF